MKLIIISGTPRIEGLTFEFVEMARNTGESLGFDTEVITLFDKKLEKCKMCGDGWGICFHDHYCAFGEKDDFGDLQKKMAGGDAYIYVTPVYWGEVSEDMKCFLDKLRRCEASNAWDKKEGAKSALSGKPSIVVANAGGGGGGIINTFNQLERAISHMAGDGQPRETVGIFDWIAVNRWNKDYKLIALKFAVTEMHKYLTGELQPWRTFKDKTKEK
ncbi:MAG: flavodoxin family protein [Defluviitaleaceae bacterium]|nr:flavodoxin family protein [Defluviitaleaceae bacterium]